MGVGAQGHRHHAQRIAVYIRVVGQKCRDGDADRDAGRGGHHVGVGDRRIVDRDRGQTGGGDVGVERPIIGLEREAVRPVVVGHRRVLPGSVRIEAQGPMQRCGDHLIGQARAVDVAGQHLAIDDRVLVARG